MLNQSSIMDLQKSRFLKQKDFNKSQSKFNGKILNSHKAQQVMCLSRKKLPAVNAVHFDESQTFIAEQSHGRILEQQIKLNSIETQYDLQKSRIEDQANAKTYRIRYPFGKQNVRIAQDVIDKYNTQNYVDQSEILKKFQDDAKRRKQQKQSQKRIVFYNQDQKSAIHYYGKTKSIEMPIKKTSILQRQKLKLYQAKRRYLENQMERQRKADLYEANQMKQIEVLLKQMKKTLQKNQSKAQNGLNNLHNQLYGHNRNSYRQRKAKMNYLDRQQQVYMNKIPIVVYKKSPYQAISYFTNSENIQIKCLQKQKIPQRPKQYDQVLKIYKLNQMRLENLSTLRKSRLSQQLYTNRSSIFHR